jgi:transcriptional regulator with XRE-family HTH domain
MEQSTGIVTLEAFAARVGCHFTTASRLRAGERMPGRELLGRIVQEFDLDEAEAFKVYTRENPAEFGEFLREYVFEASSSTEESTNETGETPDAGSSAAA